MAEFIQQPLIGSTSQSLQTEAKYAGPAHLAPLLIRMLDRLCLPDGEYPSGVISSIYYDTNDWKFLGEKRDSDYLKTKVRLRWYSDPTAKGRDGPQQSFAEVKYRVGSKRMKYRLPTQLTAEFLDATSLTVPDLYVVPELLARCGAAIPALLYPAFVVRYRRHRYVEKVTNARVSIDFDIGAPKTNPRMIANPRPCYLPQAVFEVKGSSRALPESIGSVLRLGFRSAAFSKYYECYSRLTRTVF